MREKRSEEKKRLLSVSRAVTESSTADYIYYQLYYIRWRRIFLVRHRCAPREIEGMGGRFCYEAIGAGKTRHKRAQNRNGRSCLDTCGRSTGNAQNRERFAVSQARGLVSGEGYLHRLRGPSISQVPLSIGATFQAPPPSVHIALVLRGVCVAQHGGTTTLAAGHGPFGWWPYRQGADRSDRTTNLRLSQALDSPDPA